MPKGNKLTKNDIFNLSIAKVRPLSEMESGLSKELSKQLRICVAVCEEILERDPIRAERSNLNERRPSQ